MKHFVSMTVCGVPLKSENICVAFSEIDDDSRVLAECIRWVSVMMFIFIVSTGKCARALVGMCRRTDTTTYIRTKV